MGMTLTSTLVKIMALRCVSFINIRSYVRSPYGLFVDAHDNMGGKDCYATDGPYSPANIFLFAMLCSTMNLQYCTAYIVVRYLTKYVASVDKAYKLVIKANPKEEN